MSQSFIVIIQKLFGFFNIYTLTYWNTKVSVFKIIFNKNNNLFAVITESMKHIVGDYFNLVL